MVVTSKKMLESVGKRVDELRGELEKAKEESENLTNRLKVENALLVELEAKKDDLAQEQKYIVMAGENEIVSQNSRIAELETDLKLLCKKHEILKRDWDF